MVTLSLSSLRPCLSLARSLFARSFPLSFRLETPGEGREAERRGHKGDRHRTREVHLRIRLLSAMRDRSISRERAENGVCRIAVSVPQSGDIHFMSLGTIAVLRRVDVTCGVLHLFIFIFFTLM